MEECYCQEWLLENSGTSVDEQQNQYPKVQDASSFNCASSLMFVAAVDICRPTSTVSGDPTCLLIQKPVEGLIFAAHGSAVQPAQAAQAVPQAAPQAQLLATEPFAPQHSLAAS
ncbi:hypothetical protein MBM_03769 [Drepanopeziza brunnea f. sp. 'multigermtubi' MB_m1]|uniref:Uncharacterized protein n=1 Tax=Marssonina brunnea f. sp. multigermtubi (strain MB_m1) TaxID=1072389 RepID=K1WZC9_MARBU|nr:uncharacterized protein MBM_03769 [Drepanopeziza brunnea f. sp. 'multigermtubi' MB_m1]EKD17997.1 hypothetical protein MBM_03769 [Drepanopeziza brunnea f. sp. 'multigermtubi' MB_m1]